MSPTPLGAEIAALIRETGPIGIDRYMALCLGHPVHGYYRTRDPLGPRGDFTTAPEISQMFGELVGVWIASVWAAMGAPAPLRLVELGPGRGTLMADALRALRTVAPTAAIDLHLVETSPVLRAAQEATLGAATPTWHADVASVPPGPAIVVANEFFDCLPVRQFVRTARGWCERLVGLADGALAFGLAPDPTVAITAAAAEGALMTLPAPALDLARTLAQRVRDQGGALLVVDYGHVRPGFTTPSRRSPGIASSGRSTRRARPTSPCMSTFRPWRARPPRRGRRSTAPSISAPSSMRWVFPPARPG